MGSKITEILLILLTCSTGIMVIILNTEKDNDGKEKPFFKPNTKGGKLVILFLIVAAIVQVCNSGSQWYEENKKEQQRQTEKRSLDSLYQEHVRLTLDVQSSQGIGLNKMDSLHGIVDSLIIESNNALTDLRIIQNQIDKTNKHLIQESNMALFPIQELRLFCKVRIDTVPIPRLTKEIKRIWESLLWSTFDSNIANGYELCQDSSIKVLFGPYIMISLLSYDDEGRPFFIRFDCEVKTLVGKSVLPNGKTSFVVNDLRPFTISGRSSKLNLMTFNKKKFTLQIVTPHLPLQVIITDLDLYCRYSDLNFELDKKSGVNSINGNITIKSKSGNH